MQFQTRKPSGKPGFPLILLAGIEAGGKTWAAVEATGMEDVDRAFFLEIGENTADGYGAVPGANFEVIEHDGTLGQIRQAIQWASEQPAAPGKYNMLIVDSMTEVWDLIVTNAQQTANNRSKRGGRKGADASITMDLWNAAKSTWGGIVTQCRRFPGVTIMTARLKMTSIVDDNGQPTKFKDWKIEAEKSLPYSVQVVLQAREPRRWTLTKIVTTIEALQLPPGGEMTFGEFSIEKLLTTMGITSEAEKDTFVETRANGELDGEESTQGRSQAPTHQRPPQQQQQLPALPPNARGEIERMEAAGEVRKLQELWKLANAHGNQELKALTAAAGKRAAEANAEKLARAELGATHADPVAEAQAQIQAARESAQARPQTEALPLADAMGAM